jgi:hypothetical protein
VSWITVKISCCVSVDFSEMDRTKSRLVRFAMGGIRKMGSRNWQSADSSGFLREQGGHGILLS